MYSTFRYSFDILTILQNKYERANEKAANMSDEQLRRKFESSTNTFEKMGYAQEWKDRHGN